MPKGVFFYSVNNGTLCTSKAVKIELRHIKPFFLRDRNGKINRVIKNLFFFERPFRLGDIDNNFENEIPGKFQ